MTNKDRNIRTLIVCFVIALVALVPLRIIESQALVNENIMVLGEDTYVEEEPYEEEYYVEEEVVDDNEMVLGEEAYAEEEVIEEEIVEEEIELPSAEVLE